MAYDEYDEYKPNIIIDNGSGYIKAGLSGDEDPRAYFPSIVGYPKYPKHSEFTIGGNEKEFFVGEEAENYRGVLKLNYPIEHGEINDWDDMEKIWGHIFTNELRVAPEEHNVMITEFSEYSKINRQKTAQIMFEIFNVPGLYIINPAVLSLYSKGKFTGFVLDLGDGTTQFTPVFDGFRLDGFYDYFYFGGRDLTQYIVDKLNNYFGFGYKTNEWEIIKYIKEKVCYIALDYEEELKSYEPYYYELPDGSHIKIEEERIRVPEAIFQPSLINPSYKNYKITQMLYDTIQKCDIDIRKELYNNIVLSGGNSMFNGLPERLTKEIKAVAPESMKEEVRVIASPERKYAAWIGGSILSSLSTFESSWITKTEYEESGAIILHRKCFN